jgi:predicted dehydrogenase/threonine dehydrogenase-like Zn-dependent dehydrogenase
MKQVVLNNGRPLVSEIPAPTPQPGRLLVANLASVISSGTERAAVSDGGGSLPMRAARNPELVLLAMRLARERGVRETVGRIRSAVSDSTALGYASAGVVLDSGGLGDVAVGQAVACAGAGYANHAEVISVPRNLVAPVPHEVELRDAAFTTLGAIAMQGVRRAEASLGERVAVIGLGLLGLLTIQLLRAAGCAVIGVEPDAARRELALTLGAERSLAPETAVGEVREWAEGVGADAAIVTAAGTSSAIVNDAVAMVRRKGRVVPVGDVGLSFTREALYQREADVLISTSYGPGRYDRTYEEQGVDYPLPYVRWTENRNMSEFLRLLAARLVDVEPLIGLELPLERALEAYAALASQPPPLTAVLTYSRSREHATIASRSIRTSPPAAQPGSSPTHAVRVGVIGPGAFIRGVHLANLKADGAAPIVAVAARHGTTASDVARAAGNGALATTDWRCVVEHPDVDLVLIGTRHDSHAEIAAGALRAGKAVFVEKPLGLTRAQIDEVWRAGAGEQAPLIIGFNRPLASLSQRLIAQLRSVSGPRQVVIRVNAPLAAEHWLNDRREGGGRILGEGCHFFDYANWLCGVPVSVSGAAARASAGVSTIEHASFTIAYENGSVAAVQYSGLGPASLPKERIEVLAGGRAWVLDDFRRLTSFDGESSQTVESPRADKGHAALIARALAACRGEERYLPGLREAYLAQSVALAAVDAAASGATRAVSLAPEGR